VFGAVLRVVAGRRPLIHPLATDVSLWPKGQIDMTYLPLSPDSGKIDVILAYSHDHVAGHCT
jgi:hypothetical protein